MMKPLAQNTLIQNRYLIVHLIGKGGMGEVYLSVDQRLGRAVALKRTFFAGDENLRAAFEREAKILARVRHPVLPKVSDHFGEGEEQYLVMEHISGDDLSKRLEVAQKPFPISWVMFWADQLLDALSYLHSHEPPIIHRDIKPQNLKLTDENHIILLDFGLSKNTANLTNVSDSSSSTAGSIVGYTPHYAPMEQIRGIGTSPRSDIYALSATLYQLMTNEVPSDALSRADSLLNGMDDPIKPLHEINPEIPEAVSEVILKGMEVSQDKRFKDAREMQKVLRKAFTQMQTAMSAQTIAFTVPESGGQADPFTSSPRSDDSIQRSDLNLSLGGSSLTPQDYGIEEKPAAEDFDATIQYNAPPQNDGEVRQADVKTEVFLAGSTPFTIPDPVPAQEPVPIENDYYSPPEEDYSNASVSEAENYSTANEDYSTPAEGGYSPDATVPLINFGGGGDDAEDISSFGAESQPDPFATVTGAGVQDHNYDDEAHEESQAFEAAAPAAAVVPAKKKKRSGAAFAVVGGLAALLLLIGAAAGGGWYVYTYHPELLSGAVEEPTPSPTLEVTPTPEETPMVVLDSNTDANSNSELAEQANTNITVEPTPTPVVTTDSRPPTAPAGPRKPATPRQAPTKRTSTPAPKGPIFVQ